jgi:hypothetical protein
MVCKRNKLGREGNTQVVEFDLYIDGGIDWWCPLVRKLKTEYKHLVGGSQGYYRWEVPDCKYTKTENGETVVDNIPTAEGFREEVLAEMIRNSTDAKELIRKAFEIPDLPAAEVVAEIEAKNKKKRSKSKTNEKGLSSKAILEEL